MPELAEPAPYAEGIDFPERAVCRHPIPSVTSLIWQQSGIFLAYFAFTHFLLRTDLFWVDMTWCGYLVVLLAFHWVYRVEANTVGISSGLPWGNKFVKWDEVKDFYLTWDKYNKPPVSPGQYALGALISPGQSQFERMPEPEELTAVIASTGRPLRLRPGMVGREELCRLVRQGADVASAKEWKAREYRIPGIGREFAYQAPLSQSLVYGGFIPTAVLVVVLGSLIPSELWVMAASPSLMGSSIVTIIYLSWTTISSAARNVTDMLWRRELVRRQGEKITVTDQGMVWEDRENRVESPWGEILGSNQESKFPFLGGRQPWRVRTQNGDFTFIPGGLVLGGGLPAIIYSRCPQLWAHVAPIAEARESS